MLMIRRDYIRSSLMIDDLIERFNGQTKLLSNYAKVIEQIEEENYFKQSKISALND